jgi:UDP-2,3-diacylglucosamine pyrophosphatase LpxH
MNGRILDVAVISDLHLATHACKAKKLLKYLKSISPQTLVLNGDIIDSWRFTRNYFPKPQLKVVRYLLKMLEKGVNIYYISGNHDEFLRRFNNIEIGKLIITDQLVLDLNGEKTWIFHGDIFDRIIHKAKWLAKFGAAMYGFLTIVNKLTDQIRKMVGYDNVILYKCFKKRAAKKDDFFYSRFETTVCNAAMAKKCTTVICGHTHSPKDKLVNIKDQQIRYMNCGDWVEHFTAAEYANQQWNLHFFTENEDEQTNDDHDFADTNDYYQNVFREIATACL